jgi:hypothetical protein
VRPPVEGEGEELRDIPGGEHPGEPAAELLDLAIDEVPFVQQPDAHPCPVSVIGLRAVVHAEQELPLAVKRPYSVAMRSHPAFSFPARSGSSTSTTSSGLASNRPSSGSSWPPTYSA